MGISQSASSSGRAFSFGYLPGGLVCHRSERAVARVRCQAGARASRVTEQGIVAAVSVEEGSDVWR